MTYGDKRSACDAATRTRLARTTRNPRNPAMVAVALTALSIAPVVHAFTFNFANPDLSGDFNTTVSYTSAYRLRSANPALLYGPSTPVNINLDDGDNNFQHRGIVENRVDLFSEFDIRYKSFGARVSAEAYYDTVYNRHNANNSPFSSNNLSVPYNQFTDATRTAKGRQAELLDAFVFGTQQIGSVPVTLRVGQLAQLWGETLFFGANGIAGGMAPVDIDKLLSSPSAEFKQIIMPVPQAAVSAQLPHNFSVSAYYQFGWRSDQLPPAGSYFSSADILGQGAESLFLPIPGFPPQLHRVPDQQGKDTGQYGFQLKFSPSGWNADFGIYAIRFNAKDPEIYANPATGSYRLTYPNGIRSYGASFSTNLGDTNVAGEISIRHNMPLTSDLVVDFTGTGNNTNNPLYAVGNTMHANVSMLYSVPRTPLWRDATLAAEIGWNRRLSITANPQALDPGATRDAMGVGIVFTPNYYQVLAGLDIGVPLGFTYTPFGRSSVIAFGGNGYHTGSFTLGVRGTYEQIWKIALNYTRYLGPTAPLLTSAGTFSFGQTLADRDFLSLSLSRSF